MDSVFAKLREKDNARSEEDHIEGCILKVLFLRRDALVVDDLFPALQRSLGCDDFQKEFLEQFRQDMESKLEGLRKEVQRCESAGRDVRFYTVQMPAIERQLKIRSLESYLDFLRDPKEGHCCIVEMLDRDYASLNDGVDSNGYVAEHYPLYQIGSFLFEKYIRKISVLDSFNKLYAMRLIELYRKLGINLPAVDQQFEKYNLLSMTDELSICNHKESQTIVDSRIGLYFWIDVPRELLFAIESAIANRWVTNIAFDISHITEGIPAFEDMEYGSLFSFEALQLPNVSKLYDHECYENALWIKVDKIRQSMTFEELCATPFSLDDNVVTQVVHLEFFVDQGQYFIKHLDHEFILYTREAFAHRRYDATVKGYKKRKTFKIDKARIPFDFSFESRYFLFLILDAYFKNKGLIREYFSSISQG